MKERNIQIAIMVKPYNTYTYALPSLYVKLSGFTVTHLLGARVAIPLGKRKSPIMGIVVDTDTRAVDASVQLREVSWVLDVRPLFSQQYITMVRELALRYAIQEGCIYASVIPAPLRSIATTLRFFTDVPEIYTLEEVCALQKEQKEKYIALWWEKRYAFIQHDAREYDVYSLAQEPPWAIKANARAQRAILHALWEEGALTKEEIHEKSGVKNYATIKQLISAGFIDVEKAEESPEAKCVQYAQGHALEYEEIQESHDTHALHVSENTTVQPCSNQALPPCTDEQNAVLASLRTRFDIGGTVELLFGVTGSGKSRVYCELIQYCLSKGKHAILLAPEIALVQKLARDVDTFFSGVPYYIYHGYQSPLRKKQMFYTMFDITTPSILIGTRSALFVPIVNVGLCILDEEHDTSYKQEQGAFLYNAKDVAWYIAQSNNAMLLLGSATPDCKTLYSVEQGSIQEHVLNTRATGVQMPSLEFVDMKQENHILSAKAIEALHAVIERKEQAVILLNRRGYAPHMYCTACNTVQQCPHCQVSLLYHKAMNILRCSYCGYNEHFPKPCSLCGSIQYITLGIGTEQLQEELSNCFPKEEPCIRLDRDIARSPRHIRTILDSFMSGTSSILVGTQMLAKGHDFPRVSLSIIVDADSGLHFPDYRAMERTFQLIMQTAGRAGRASKQGHVIIQSHCVDNPCWQFVLNNDYRGLYRHEMNVRAKKKYPPFVHIAMIRIICTIPYDEAKQHIHVLRQAMRKETNAEQCIVLGPVPSPIAVIRGQYRYQMLVKGNSWQGIRALYGEVQHYLAGVKGIRVVLDIDPISMM